MLSCKNANFLIQVVLAEEAVATIPDKIIAVENLPKQTSKKWQRFWSIAVIIGKWFSKIDKSLHS